MTTDPIPESAALEKQPRLTRAIPKPWVIAVSASPLVIYPLLAYLTVSPIGTHTFLVLQLPVVLLFLAAMLAMAIAPFLMFSRALRPSAIRTLIVAAIYSATTLFGGPLGGQVRMAAFHRLAKRSAPLVQAIRGYEALHGEPPPELAALAPDFLPAVPGTGMALYPRYEYHVGDEARTHYEGNPWALEVQTSTGILNWDVFLYFPRQNYPKTGYGGVLEPVADWAYVIE